MGVVKVHIPEKAVKFILKKKQRLNTQPGVGLLSSNRLILLRNGNVHFDIKN
jgi:hypothetical protein